jgi:hypothetical protein
MRLVGAAADEGLRPAPEASMLGKTLLHLDQIVAILAPGLDSTRSVRRAARAIAVRKLARAVTPEATTAHLLEIYEVLQRLPERLNTITSELVDHEFSVRVRVLDEERFMGQLQKIANRIAAAIVTGALLLGASRLAAPAETGGAGQGLAWVLFGLAALSAAWLAGGIVLDAVRRRRG